MTHYFTIDYSKNESECTQCGVVIKAEEFTQVGYRGDIDKLPGCPGPRPMKQTPIDGLIAELRDPGYFASWQANIAMAFTDECSRSSHCDTANVVANKAASNFLHTLINVPVIVPDNEQTRAMAASIGVQEPGRILYRRGGFIVGVDLAKGNDRVAMTRIAPLPQEDCRCETLLNGHHKGCPVDGGPHE